MASAPSEHTPLLFSDDNFIDSGEQVSSGAGTSGLNIQSSTEAESVTLKRSHSEGFIYQRQPYVFTRERAVAGGMRERGMNIRINYYGRLDNTPESRFVVPDHILPPEFYSISPIRYSHTIRGGNQPSIITIFSIWNTMMGTSILSMPWALEQAGFITGILIIILMASLTTYTAHVVLQSPKAILGPDLTMMEFADVCRHRLGRFGEFFATIFSFAALLGAAIVYWVLMTNFLYHVVTFVHDKIVHEHSSQLDYFYNNGTGHNASQPDVVCVVSNSSAPPINSTLSAFMHESMPLLNSLSLYGSDKYNHTSMFNTVWSERKTVPFFLVALLGGIVNIKRAEFFTKFNALGTVSVAFIITFVSIKAYQWGLNVNFESRAHTNFIPQFRGTFPALTGMLSLAYFIHNCIISIMRNQRHPEKNSRDLCIAYFLVMATYLFIGVTYYITFPLPKDCIADNLLNNFYSSDLLAFLSRCFLFVQMFTVFPLLMYILRLQFMTLAFQDPYPSLRHVLVMNVVVMAICILFAVFLPQIGQIIRFVGALSGFAYLFTLPCLVYLRTSYVEGQLTTLKSVLHGFLIVLGLCNLIAQFIII